MFFLDSNNILNCVFKLDTRIACPSSLIILPDPSRVSFQSLKNLLICVVSTLYIRNLFLFPCLKSNDYRGKTRGTYFDKKNRGECPLKTNEKQKGINGKYDFNQEEHFDKEIPSINPANTVPKCRSAANCVALTCNFVRTH